MGDEDEMEIQHKVELEQFQTVVDGYIAVLQYHIQDEKMIFTHTGTPSPIKGRGVGSALVHAGLTYARQHGFKVVPICWFVDGYISRHPEFQDLLANA